MSERDGTALSSILVGDIVTPHGPSDAFEYVASVLIIDGELRQACLPDVLGGYPNEPAKVQLTAEQFDALAASAHPTADLPTLLAYADADTLMLEPQSGAANLRRYVANHEPSLLSEPALHGGAERVGRASWGAVLLIAVAILFLLGLGAWIAVRVVSGY